MIGIVVKAIRPNDAASQEKADNGGGDQQPADEENQERSEHRWQHCNRQVGMTPAHMTMAAASRKVQQA
jgi:hypothetical protein